MAFNKSIEFFEGTWTVDQTQVKADMTFYNADGRGPDAGGAAVYGPIPTVKGNLNRLAVTYAEIVIP